MALKLGELVAVLGVDGAKFDEGLEKAHGRFQSWADKLGPAAAIAGGAAAAALAAGIASGLELDAAQAKLTAQLGDSAYAEDLGKVAGNLYGRGFAESAGAAMESVRAVMSSGLLPEDADQGTIEEITRQAQALASTFDVDVQAATRAAGQLIRNGLAKDASEAFDIVTRGFQQTGDQAGDLLDTYSEYSVQFRKLGLDGVTATGLLTQGLKAGARDVDTVADTIKEFSIKAVDGTKGVAAGYEALGLNAKQMTDQIAQGGPAAEQGLATVLDRLRAMKDPAAQSAAAVALFGTKAEDMGAALFALDPSSAVTAMGKVDGAAGKMADTLEQSASQQLEAFKRQASQALVQELAKAIPTLQAIAGWLKENKDVVVPLAEGLGILAIAIATIVGAIKVWTIVQTALNVVLSLNPIGLIVIAIAALVAGIILLWNNSEAFRNFWIGAWELIKGAALAVWNWIKDNWKNILTFLTGPIGLAVRYISQHWDSIKAGATRVKDWIVEKWTGLIDWFRGLPGRISRAASGLWDGIKSSYRNMINFLVGKWNNLSFTIGGGSIAGISIPSLTLSTPDLPYLAAGGNILQGGMAEVGERGRERLFLPTGASVQPLRPGQDGTGGSGMVTVRVVHETPNGDKIREEIFEGALQHGQTPGEFLKVA
ncbi:phage tail tape measure protein [Actinoplanes sp. NPDC049316]|uniref:phage tail tape measure protein n=1 Tax=Actinoplanes sp. NPDC049316 TaxID=3154727 RepID=UPI003433E163